MHLTYGKTYDIIKVTYKSRHSMINIKTIYYKYYILTSNIEKIYEGIDETKEDLYRKIIK